MRSPYVTAARHVGNCRWFAEWRRFGHRLDLLTYPRIAGRVRFAARLPTLLLTARGRRTGQLRTMPLLFVRDREAFVVVGSNWGQADHPGWSANLLANPAVIVQVGARRVDVRAKLARGSERDRLWAQLREMWLPYDTYWDRSGRELRTFRLEPEPRKGSPPPAEDAR